MQDAIFVAIELRRDGFERAGHKHLTAAGFACLYTAHERRIKTRGRNGKPREDSVIEWTLPGYIVLAHDGRPEFWPRVAAVKFPKSQLPVMAQPVRIAGSSTVPKEAVCQLMERCGEIIMPIELPRLKIDQKVKILSDPFAGHVGTVGDVDMERATVHVPIFGRLTAVKIDVDKLEAA